MSNKIWFDPTSDKWVLSDGEHYLEVPHWAREIIVDEFERETRQLKDENAKLRELVRYIMHQCNDGNPRCDECIDWNDGECVALLRMRELGVEVDDD